MISTDIFSALVELADLDKIVTRITVGVFTVMLETADSAGLSSCFRDPPGTQAGGLQLADHMKDKTLRLLTDDYYNGTLLQKSVAVAALNAGLPSIPCDLPELYGQDLIRQVTGDGHLVVIGNFPFVKSLSKVVGKLTLIQQPPHLGYLGVKEAEKIDEPVDSVIITSSSLINGTLDSLLKQFRGAYIVLLGATTPMHPMLFDRGVSALSGVRILDREATYSGVAQASSFRNLKGLERITWINPEIQANTSRV